MDIHNQIDQFILRMKAVGSSDEAARQIIFGDLTNRQKRIEDGVDPLLDQFSFGYVFTPYTVIRLLEVLEQDMMAVSNREVLRFLGQVLQYYSGRNDMDRRAQKRLTQAEAYIVMAIIDIITDGIVNGFAFSSVHNKAEISTMLSGLTFLINQIAKVVRTQTHISWNFPEHAVELRSIISCNFANTELSRQTHTLWGMCYIMKSIFIMHDMLEQDYEYLISGNEPYQFMAAGRMYQVVHYEGRIMEDIDVLVWNHLPNLFGA